MMGYIGIKQKVQKNSERIKYLKCKAESIKLIRIKESKDLQASDGVDADVLISIIEDPGFEALDAMLRSLMAKLGIQNQPVVSTKKDEFQIKNLYLTSLQNESVAMKSPQLAKEWDSAKNQPLSPDMFSLFSSQKVWWKCEKGHEWQATIANRSYGNGCPYCAGIKIISGETDLLSRRPDLAAEWHPTKNGDLLPSMVALNSKSNIWWKCEKGHEWQATISNRNKGDGCPYCSGRRVISGNNDLQTLNPDLAAEWHPTKNGDLLPSMVALNSNKAVWWKCEKGHEWQATIAARTSRGHGCPYCSGHRIKIGFNDLITTKPNLAAEWHPTKNGDLLPSQVSATSGRKVWWKCEKGHEWQATIANRSYGNGCPYCAGKKVLSGESDLLSRRPDLAAEWHPTKNGDLLPSMVTPGSGKKAWWKCEKGHEWQATIVSRSEGNGCPVCFAQKRQRK